MRKAIRQKWASLSEYSGSSTHTATRAPSTTGGSDDDDDSYYYYSSGSGSYYATDEASRKSATATSSKAASSRASAASPRSDAASTFSAASGSGSGSVSIKEATTSSAHTAPSSLASSSDALVASAPAANGKGGPAETGTSKLGRSVSIATTTTSNGVTVDNSDALVPVSSTSLRSSQASPLNSSSSGKNLAIRMGGSRAVDAAVDAPASPYHFSEEELARQPWACEGDATTTYTSEEGGVLVTRAPDALATIHTYPIAVPPSVEEAQRCRRAGGLPYPSHLTFRIVPGAGTGSAEDGDTANVDSADAEAAARRAKEGKRRLDEEKPTVSVADRATKVLCDSCCGGHFRKKRETVQRSAEARADARQKSYHTQLRSHHVPLVNFRTSRDPTVALVDCENTLPTIEEAADYRHCVENMTGAEAEPKKLEKAMRQRRRPASGLHWKTKYAYGRRAGGGPRGIGESAFAHEGDPHRFWIAQLHERSQVHLEPIEAE